MADVTLSEAIESVRVELARAQAAGAAAGTRFAVGPVTLELTVQVERTAGGEASVKLFDLLSIGGSAERAATTAQKVTLQLTPLPPAGSDRFEVGSAQAARPDGPAGP